MTWGGDHEPPAGARASADSAAPAGSSGAEFRALWKAARTARGKATRGRHARAAKQAGPGMIRKPPPDDAA